MLNKTLISLFLFVFVGNIALAQEMNGYVHSNYSGITGAQINPTAIVNSKLYFDLNLIGIHLNVDNNFIYLARDEYKFTRFLSMNAEFPEHEVRVSPTKVENRMYYDYYNENLKQAYTQIKVFGPSFMYAKNDKAIGLSTSVRNIVSADDIPYEIAKFGAEGFDYYPQHRIRYLDYNDFRAGGMSFAEIGLSYAQVIHKQFVNHWTAGVTLKYLMGFGGAYWYVDNVDYMMPNGDTLVLFNGNGEAGISLPVDYADNDVHFPDQLIKGSGIGADIGITYQRKVRGHTNKRYAACEQPFEDYFFKVGFSLIDFGYVNFKKNLRNIRLTDAEGTWYDFTNQNIETVDELFTSMSNAFGGTPNVVTSSEEFKVFLPSAASVQFDYRVNERMYVNSTLVMPLIISKSNLVRPTTLSVTPRWERDNFELAVPVTLYNYMYPRIGLSARFSKVVVGTDKIGGFFGFHHFTGMDFYVMVKLSLIKGNCIGKGSGASCANREYRQYQRERKRLKVR